MIKRILFILPGIVAIAQLIQPDRSVPVVNAANDFLHVTGAPVAIQANVIGACYDCHSDRTDHPWYAYITPVNFWLQSHINEGREVLNFSRWNEFAGTEAAAENSETLAEGEMPPALYARMHGHARLSDAERQELIAWFDQLPGGEGGAEGSPSRERGEGEHEDEEG